MTGEEAGGTERAMKGTEGKKERGKTPIGEYKEIDSIMSYFDDDILKKPVNNYKTDLEGEFRRKKGLAMHYYFEHMTNDYENDRKNAKSAFLSRYGNMLGKKLIEELLERMEKFVAKNKEIKEYQILDFLNIDNSIMSFNDNSLKDLVYDNGFSTQSEKFDFLLDINNEKIKAKKGEVYVPVFYFISGLVKSGDTLKIKDYELKVAGFVRDSQMNSSISSSKRFVVNKLDYDNIKSFGHLVLCVFMMYTFMKSRHGRAILSIREDEIASESSGINLTFYKTLAFAYSAFFAGVAGGMYAHYIGILGAKNFDFNKSIDILVIVVLGGLGSFTGSAIGAIVLTILPEMLRGFNDYRMFIYAVMLILMMMFRPSGLLGTKEFSLTNLVSKALPKNVKGGGKNG